jgi:hypothetical protein
MFVLDSSNQKMLCFRVWLLFVNNSNFCCVQIVWINLPFESNAVLGKSATFCLSIIHVEKRHLLSPADIQLYGTSPKLPFDTRLNKTEPVIKKQVWCLDFVSTQHLLFRPFFSAVNMAFQHSTWCTYSFVTLSTTVSSAKCRYAECLGAVIINIVFWKF